MRPWIPAILIGALCCASSVQAMPLNLNCSGTITNTSVPKDGIASEPDKERVVDYSIVVDLQRKVVSGFWNFDNAAENDLAITSESANGVIFKGHNKLVIDKSIDGSVDRITGKVDAEETQLFPNGNLTLAIWDLRCKPQKPLF